MKNDNTYSAEILFTSRSLTTKEKIKYKRVMDSRKLDDESRAEDIQIELDVAISLSIHNEKAENKDYTRYILVATDGTVYTTGSESFWSAFMDIYTELEEANELDNIVLKVLRIPSKNYTGRDFLSCELV